LAPAISDIIRVVCKFSQALNDIQNVYHGKIESGTAPSGSTLASDIADFMDAVYDYIDYGMADNVYFESVDVYNLTQDEFYGATAWPGLSQGGGTTNPMLPPQCAPLLLFPTATPGHLGKKFLPPVTDNVLDDDGSLASGYVGNMALMGADLLGGMAPGTYTVSWGIYDPDSYGYLPYGSYNARDFVATQRRRYTGKGS
jgi:hypothetical protein